MACFLYKCYAGKTIVTTAAVGIVGGLLFAYLKNRGIFRKKMWKSYDSDDALLRYAMDHSLRLLPVQQRLKELTLKQPLGRMMGAPEVTQLIQNLLRSMNAKKVIEIGVFTGYSTLGFGLALPDDGIIIACDISEEYMDVGKPFWKEARVINKIIPKIQPAVKTLDELLAAGEAGTYDLTFIDADKDNYDTYYERSLQLVRKGGIIAIDNVLWSGSVLEENPSRKGADAIKRLNTKLKTDKRIDISMLPIADGLTLAFKL